MVARRLIVGSAVAVELIVVLILVASLAAIFVPEYGGALEPADQAQWAPGASSWFGFGPFERTWVEERATAVPAGATIQVDNQAGNTSVTGADVKEIRVHATKHGRGGSTQAAQEDLGNLGVQVTQQDGRVLVSAARVGDTAAGTIDIDLTVPSDSPVTVRGSLGNIKVRGTNANVAVANSLGNVELTDPHGDIEVNASMGNVEIRGARVARSLRINDRLGNISFDGTLPPEGDGSVTASMGNVTVAIPSDSSFQVEATANLGRVRSDFPAEVSRQDAGGYIRASSGTGGFQLRIQNSMGNVELKKSR